MHDHHTITLQQWWPDIVANIIRMSAYEHIDVLHWTLDLPYKKSGKYIRKLRKMTNHKLLMPPEWIALMWDMQKEFFENLYKLPVRMIEEHNLVIANLSQIERDRYYKMTNTYFDNPRKWKNNIDTFDKQHENYIECRIEIAKDILSVLKKHYSM